ncbi:MAG: alpha/beta hydrolase [Elusimicrobia bacterium]|nr:alpha/beta hydrolase [Elusimicrobiota bacterium]
MLPRNNASSKLVYYLSVPASDGFPVVIYVQENGCRSVWPYFEAHRATFTSLGAAFAAVEVRGLKRGGRWRCPKEFLRNNSIGDRMLDYLQMLHAFRGELPGWDRRILWVGESEGGLLALMLARAISESTAAALLGSGGGLPPPEELALAKSKAMKEEGRSEQEIKQALAELLAQIGRIMEDPESSKTWLGRTNTFRWWSSYLSLNPLSDLEKLQIPLYLAHGVRDRAVPIESSDRVEARFKELEKSNLTYARYDDLDHRRLDSKGQSQEDRVGTDLLDWINKQIQMGGKSQP